MHWSHRLALAVLLGSGCAVLHPHAMSEPNHTNEDGTFDLAQYRWAKRPLLLFALDAEQDDYRRQLAEIEQHRDGFEERDMVLIRVVGSRDGHIGTDLLTLEDIQGLRLAFDVPLEGFSLVLLGKDGEEKRRETGYTPIKAIFEQIDAMPMRQQEMQEG